MSSRGNSDSEVCFNCGGVCCQSLVIPIQLAREADLAFLQTRGELMPDLTGKAGVYRWRVPARCKHLTEDGKCSIWEQRPDSCRVYQVGGLECNRARTAAGLPRVRRDDG